MSVEGPPAPPSAVAGAEPAEDRSLGAEPAEDRSPDRPSRSAGFIWDDCVRMTTLSAVAGLAAGATRLLQEARAQGISATAVQDQIPRASGVMGLRLGAFGAVFCSARKYMLSTLGDFGRASPGLTEIMACTTAGSVAAGLLSGTAPGAGARPAGSPRSPLARPRAAGGLRIAVRSSFIGAALGGTVGLSILLVRATDVSSERQEPGPSPEAEK